MIDGLNDEHREALIDVLSADANVERIVLFGSRATGTYSATSDIDIALFGDELSQHDVGRLGAIVDNLPYPHKVDLLAYRSIRNDKLRDEIDAHGLVWFNRRSVCLTASLGDVADITISNVDKKTKSDEIPVRLCNYTDVYFNQYIRSDMDFMLATATERETLRCSLFEGDVVITKDSEKDDDIGVPAYVSEDIDNLVCGYHLVILRPKPDKIDGKYLFYSLSAREAEHQFHARANGVTRFGLRKADIGTVSVPVPPLPEQRRIAHILGTLDDKIELNRRMNETLEEMARAVFKDWFVDFGPVRAKMEGREAYLPEEVWGLFPDRLVESELGLVPEGWGVRRLGDVIQVNPRRSLTKGLVAPYLAMANMPTKGHSPIEVAYRPFGSGMRYRNGDTLVARITPCLENGKTAYVDFLNDGQIGWGSTEYVVLRPSDPIPPQFAYCLARSGDFRDFAVHNMSGTSGRQRVSGNAISSFLLAVPDDLGIPEAFGRLVEPLFAQASENARLSRTLADHRDAMLPGLVSGEVRVHDTGMVVTQE